MRKLSFVLCVVVSLFALSGSSIWEGAAGVAVGTELPRSGLYIATNAFPVNTVVDITNLESGKTIRAVTSSALEAAPGLLALLSADAAEAIGLPGRALGRVRMSLPPDNVAFSRFGQRRASPADPDFDPAAFVALHDVDPSRARSAAVADEPVVTVVETIAVENRMLEGQDLIIDLPGASPDEAPLAPVRLVPLVVPRIIMVPENEVHLVEPHFAELLPVEPAPAVPPPAEPLLVIPVPQSIAEPLPVAEPLIVPLEETVAVPQFVEPLPVEPQPVAEPWFADYIITLTPSEARPPVETGLVPDPAFFIEPVPAPAPTPTPAPVYQPAFIDPSFIIEPIREPPLAALPSIILPAFPKPLEPEPEQFVAPILVPPPAPEQIFPVPMISSLQRGKYYVQIAAYASAEAVQYELSRIERIDSNLTREVVVMRGMTAHYGPVYQILIGPLNLGESGALLQRFRITHRDAFIRSGS